MEARLKLHT